MTLRKERVFTSTEDILDAQLVDGISGTVLLVLTPAHIETYQRNGDKWQQIRSSNVNATVITQRDVRGMIVISDSASVHAYLPGRVCEAASAEAQFQCGDSDDPWPIGTRKAFYNTSRNYFSGVLVPAYSGSLPPFYSAAEFVRASGPAVAFSDIRGPIRLLDHGALNDLTGSRDWGSDLASLRSGCSAGTQILSDAAGDLAQDSLRAYEINGHEASAVTAPLPFEGNINAMHTAADGTSVSVIVRSTVSHSAEYEVWRVSLECH
jgi:hypothetical protein